MNTAEAVIRHFRNTLNYIQARKEGVSHEGANAGVLGGAELGGQGSVGAEEAARLFEDVDVAGPLLKLGNA